MASEETVLVIDDDEQFREVVRASNGAKVTAELKKLDEWKLPSKSDLDLHNLSLAADGRHLAVVHQNSLISIFRLTE